MTPDELIEWTKAFLLIGLGVFLIAAGFITLWLLVTTAAGERQQ